MFDILQFLWLGIIFKPIFNLVVFFYNISPGPSLGLAVLGLAIFTRFIFLPFTLIGYKQDRILAEHKPEIEKIEEDTSLSSREKVQKVSEITKPLGINPFFSAIPLVAQIIVLGVLYQIIQNSNNIVGSNIQYFYSFIDQPEFLNKDFFGFDLTQRNLVLPVVAAFVFFIERIWEYREKKDITLKTFSQKWDPLIWPLGTFIILIILPSAKSIFVVGSVGFSLIIKAIMHSRK